MKQKFDAILFLRPSSDVDHVPNLMSKFLCLSSFALGSAHGKFDVWTGPKLLKANAKPIYKCSFVQSSKSLICLINSLLLPVLVVHCNFSWMLTREQNREKFVTNVLHLEFHAADFSHFYCHLAVGKLQLYFPVFKSGLKASSANWMAKGSMNIRLCSCSFLWPFYTSSDTRTFKENHTRYITLASE